MALKTIHALAFFDAQETCRQKSYIHGLFVDGTLVVSTSHCYLIVINTIIVINGIILFKKCYGLLFAAINVCL